MDDGYIGQIILFAGNFAPRNWAFCNGQQLAINQNQALFAILGTLYGGNGSTFFNLPDLRGVVPVSAGVAASGTTYVQGQKGGFENVSLNVSQMPSHTHIITGGTTGGLTGSATATMKVNSTAGGASTPKNNFLGIGSNAEDFYSTANSGADTLNTAAISVDTSQLKVNLAGLVNTPTGSNAPVPIMQPFLVLNYIICTNGIFPVRE